MNISTIRQQNINLLATKYGRQELAALLGYKDTVYLNQLCGGHGSFGGRTARKIEKALKLSDGWMDQLQRPDDSSVDTPATTYSATTRIGPAIQSRVPLISWVQAGDFCEAIDLFQPGDAQEWIPCPASHSDSSFALRVQGASMEPRFHEGEIIIVDPNANSDPGRFVIARKDGDKTVTFKQLMNDGDQHYLKALNPDWPNRIIEMNEDWHICGVVICKMEML